ncbi:MAG TPA: SulP family inorganic anion transporter, partial [Hydrogenophilus thermoluteolus]|nr:SulP family inorganic anion transporter [Hydrogenophilus thermoluteolus]
MTRLPLPKLFTLLPHYRANDLWADLTAGVTVGALALAVPPSGLVGKLRALYDALPTLQPASAALGFGSLALLLGWTRLERRIPKLKRLPAPLVTLVAGTAIVWWGELPVATIGSRFGAITSSLPAFTLPVVDWTQFTQLLPAALAIAVLGATESLVTARFADEKIDDLHNPNQELFAQGVANLLTPMV